MSDISRKRLVLRSLGLLVLALHTLCGVVLASAPPLQKLARTYFDSKQGLLVETEDNTVLAALNPDRGFHPASVTKVASTLAFLHEWGPDRRMRTQLLARGPIDKGILSGDIVVRSEGDPYLVFENAFLILLGLNSLGIHRVHGDVRIQGPFVFNWTPDPRGHRFKRTLAGQAGTRGWRAVKAHTREIADVGLRDVAIVFDSRAIGHERRDKPLLIHESAPLRRVLKEFNDYSNNIVHNFAQQIGGPERVERIARSAVPESLRSRIRIDNAAGGGRNNRLSPSATVAIFKALDRELARHALSLSDVLPVAGIDSGTLAKRVDSPAHRGAVVGKTGTLPSIRVSALAGVAYTQRYGRVFFAILNKGLPIARARKKQDAFIADLLEQAHPAPPIYQPPPGPAFTEARVYKP